MDGILPEFVGRVDVGAVCQQGPHFRLIVVRYGLKQRRPRHLLPLGMLFTLMICLRYNYHQRAKRNRLGEDTYSLLCDCVLLRFEGVKRTYALMNR